MLPFQGLAASPTVQLCVRPCSTAFWSGRLLCAAAQGPHAASERSAKTLSVRAISPKHESTVLLPLSARAAWPSLWRARQGPRRQMASQMSSPLQKRGLGVATSLSKDLCPHSQSVKPPLRTWKCASTDSRTTRPRSGMTSKSRACRCTKFNCDTTL